MIDSTQEQQIDSNAINQSTIKQFQRVKGISKSIEEMDEDWSTGYLKKKKKKEKKEEVIE